MNELTEREQAMLDYIVETLGENGYSPSIRDIKSALGIKSTSTVHNCLAKLEKKGYIRKEEGKSRTLRAPDDRERAAGDRRGIRASRIPVLGCVTAGMPVLAEENFDGFIDFCTESTSAAPEDLFALRVAGRSMIEAGIFDGDVVIVERTDYAENGEIVVALVGDEATVKTFFRENGHYRLQPENREMQPIIVPDAAVLGRVVASMRFYE